MEKADLEIRKANECKDLLDLPKKKENWSAQEKAEEDMEKHFIKSLDYLKEVAMLMRGLEAFRNGLIYEAMAEARIIKKQLEKERN